MKGIIINNFQIKELSHKHKEKWMENLPSVWECSFRLENSCVSFANAIRRCMVDEVPIYALDVLPQNIRTNDRSILQEEVIERLTSIPLNQDFLDDLKEINLTISLENTNKDEAVKQIRSDSIVVMSGDKNVTKYVLDPIHRICELSGGGFIQITNIFVNKKRSCEDGKYSFLDTVKYDVVDMEPFVAESIGKHKGTSCLEYDPKVFDLGFVTMRNISPKSVIRKCCDELTGRLVAIKKDLVTYKGMEVPQKSAFLTEKIKITMDGAIAHVEMTDEFFTLSRLIAQYCYINHPDIKFVAPYIVHPLIRKGCVKLIGDVGIVIEAIDAIMADLNELQKKSL